MMGVGNNLLIIFVRNPELGKVKTRLAAAIGPEKALEVYRVLLAHTRAITLPLQLDKVVFFADTPAGNTLWEADGYQLQVQQAGDLGEKMAGAFRFGFDKGYERIGIIGSDCYELSSEILLQGFALLQQHDLVAGPAADGGYYFLGMKRFLAGLFENKTWSSPTVLQDTLADAKTMGLTSALLPVLTDVDEVADLATMPAFAGLSNSGLKETQPL